MKLSAYTIAMNCTDISDCNIGIVELKEYLSKTKNPIITAYIRFYKLHEKINKLNDYGKRIKV